MCSLASLKARICPAVRLAALLVAALLLLPGAARADVLVVDCTGANPMAFPSISAALASLPLNSATEPHTITVTGTCTENVTISNRQRITIEAPPGQTANVANAASPARAVFLIDRSRSILLRRLTVSGGSSGIRIRTASEVMAEGCTIENNAGNGIALAANSTLQLGGNALAQAVQIRNNDGSGISSASSFVGIRGNTTVENNGFQAIFASGGSIQVDGNVADNIFRNNAAGLSLGAVNGTFFGQNLFQNNGNVGVTVAGNANVLFFQRVLPDGTVRAAIIEGHTHTGISVANLGVLLLSGGHQVHNNGSPTAPDFLRSGVSISRGAMTATGAMITNNDGPGILVDFNANLSMGGAAGMTISNNTQEGIRVTRMSVAGLFGTAITLAGNGVASLSCDATSLVFGDGANIPGALCNNIEKKPK